MPKLREERFLRVKVDMVTRCQLRCVMCHFAHPEFKESPVTMGRELLEKVAAEIFPRAHDVVLSSSAEPLLAKELPRALELRERLQEEIKACGYRFVALDLAGFRSGSLNEGIIEIVTVG